MQRSVARLAAGVSLVALVALGCSPSTDVTVAGRPDGTPSPDAPQSSPPDPTPSPAQPTATPLADVPELPDLVEEVRSGVVRLDVIACNGGLTGSGFLVGPDLVLTAAHVVDGASVIGLETDDGSRSGVVIGIERSSDLALVQASEPFDGHLFDLADDDARIGADVVVMGYPEGLPFSITEGVVSAVDRVESFTDIGEIGPLLQTDAAINFGNSGGPIVDRRGHIVGVVTGKLSTATGIAWGLEAGRADELSSGWIATPAPEPAAACDTLELGPDYAQEIGIGPGAADHPDRDFIVASLDTYFGGINTGDYSAAHGILAPEIGGSLVDFEDAVFTSWDTDVTIHEISTIDAVEDEVRVTFTSFQDPSRAFDGVSSCTEWDLTYRMVFGDDGVFRIAGATTNGEYPLAC